MDHAAAVEGKARKRFGPWRGSLRPVLALAAGLLALLLGAIGGPVLAQTCTADVQCPNAGQPMATCIGDTLVVKRSMCSGTCREVEVRRQRCQTESRGQCLGNSFVLTVRRCNASLGICEQRQERDLCLPSCSCRGKRLVVATGRCFEAIGCGRSVVHCKHGCTCKPEPRCLDEAPRR